MERAFDELPVSLGYGSQLPCEVPDQVRLRPDFGGNGGFDLIGELHKSKFLSRHQESFRKLLAELRHFRFQASQPGTERILDPVAFQNGINTPLYQQGSFLPRVLNEIAIQCDFLANNAQEIRNLVSHYSDPEIDVR